MHAIAMWRAWIGVGGYDDARVPLASLVYANVCRDKVDASNRNLTAESERC